MWTEPRSSPSAEAVRARAGLEGREAAPVRRGQGGCRAGGRTPGPRRACSPEPASHRPPPQPRALRGSRPSSAEAEVAHPRAGGARPRAGWARGAPRGAAHPRPSCAAEPARSGPASDTRGRPGPLRRSAPEPAEPGGAGPEGPGVPPAGDPPPRRRGPAAAGKRKQRGHRTPRPGKRPHPQSPGLDPPRRLLPRPGSWWPATDVAA